MVLENPRKNTKIVLPLRWLSLTAILHKVYNNYNNYKI